MQATAVSNLVPQKQGLMKVQAVALLKNSHGPPDIPHFLFQTTAPHTFVYHLLTVAYTECLVYFKSIWELDISLLCTSSFCMMVNISHQLPKGKCTKLQGSLTNFRPHFTLVFYPSLKAKPFDLSTSPAQCGLQCSDSHIRRDKELSRMLTLFRAQSNRALLPELVDPDAQQAQC